MCKEAAQRRQRRIKILREKRQSKKYPLDVFETGGEIELDMSEEGDA